MKKSIIVIILSVILAAGMVTAGSTNPYESYTKNIVCEWTDTPKVIDGVATTLLEYEGLQNYGTDSWSGWWWDDPYSGVGDFAQNNINLYFSNDADYLYLYADVGVDNSSDIDDVFLAFFDLDMDGNYDELTEPYLFMWSNNTKDYDPWIGIPETFKTNYQGMAGWGASPNTNLSHRQWEFAFPIGTWDLPSTFSLALYGGDDDFEWIYPTDWFEYDMNDSTNWSVITLSTEPTEAAVADDVTSFWDYLQENWWLIPTIVVCALVVAVGIWAIMRPPRNQVQPPQYDYPVQQRPPGGRRRS